MLTISTLARPSDKASFLEQFDAQNSTWVVSDLRNKFEVQQLILEKQSFYEDVSVLRASELWRLLLKRAFPEMKLVSTEFISTWIKEQIKRLTQMEGGPKLGTNAHQVVSEMIDLMASVHSHELGAQRMREWFRENPESLQRWGGWFLLSEEFFQLLIEQYYLSPRWCASYLQNQNDWKNFWNRPLIFDLGSQLSQVEADLIRALSRDLDVLVLAPNPEWKKEFEYLLKPYDFLTSQSDQKASIAEQSHDFQTFSRALRFSGVLGEVKKACEIVRIWLEEKVPAHQIGLIAPDMEKYWPLLQPLLEIEGIPTSKDIFSRLQTLPAVSQWLSEIRLKAQEVRYSDLEAAYFQSEEPGVRFEEFYALFAELISESDLKRHELIQKSFQTQFSLNDEITRDEWLGFSAQCWKSKGDIEPLEICFREILMNAEPQMKLRVSSWIHLTEQVAAKKEIRLKKGNRAGIQLSNLSAGDSLKVTHRIFLGLTESMLRSKGSNLLSPREVLAISNELGFSLEHPEVSTGEFDLAWLAENTKTNSYYFYPQTGFAGGAEAPCSLWLQKSDESSQSLCTPGEIRWDYLLQTEKLDWDPQEQQAVKISKSLSLSPSSIEAYRKCPFTFATQKIFRLVDLPVMDFDVDRRTRGLMAHALLEKLCDEPRRFDWSRAEIQGLIEELKPNLGLASMDRFIWEGLKERHVQMALRFLSFEKEWLQSFPATRILAREKSFEFYWDLDRQTVGKTGEWKIRGRIDRIDHDEKGHVVLIDYKQTLGDYKNHAKWVEKNQLQLALYALAIEEGVIEGIEASEVVGAFYYVLKNMNRDRGLKVEEAAGDLFQLDKKTNRIKEAKKKDLLDAVKKIIQEVILNMKDGKFAALPLEPEKCGECNWKNLCKAPHLN
jgi:RecB family exonuclease